MAHLPIVAGMLVAGSMRTNVVAHLQAMMHCCLDDAVLVTQDSITACRAS